MSVTGIWILGVGVVLLGWLAFSDHRRTGLAIPQSVSGPARREAIRVLRREKARAGHGRGSYGDVGIFSAGFGDGGHCGGSGHGGFDGGGGFGGGDGGGGGSC
jgi:single-strand DNA-binding protein